MKVLFTRSSWIRMAVISALALIASGTPEAWANAYFTILDGSICAYCFALAIIAATQINHRSVVLGIGASAVFHGIIAFSKFMLLGKDVILIIGLLGLISLIVLAVRSPALGRNDELTEEKDL